MADKANRQQEQAQAKVLRIGIVQGGKVVHERLIKPGQSVTIGESPKNTFVFTAPGLPKRFTLFQIKGSAYHMSFTPEMQGKVALEEGVKSLSGLRDAGSTSVALTHKCRGKIAVGDVTVLFQFVAAPPESARKIARQDFRPKILDEDDPVFLGFLALWSAMAAVLMIYVYNTEPVESVSMDEIPDRFVQIVKPAEDKDPPEEIPKEEDPNAEGEIVKKEEKPKEAAEDKVAKEPKSKEEKVAAAQKREQDREKVLQSRLLTGLIGTRGEANNGSTVADVFADGDASFQDLDKALQGVEGTAVANEENVGMRGQTDKGGRGDASIGDVGKGGGGEAKVGGVATAAPKKVTSNLGTVDVPEGEGADAIRATIKKFSSQVKKCYEARLKENPNIAGRVAIEIDVASGRVTTVDISENTTGDKELESCLKSRVRSWRFPAEVTESGIYMPFSLNAS
jgi:outer membrane biosynthesis protein TonB